LNFFFILNFFSSDFIERFDDDDDNSGRVFNNNNPSVEQYNVPIDDIIAISRLPIDFETSVLKTMMSRYFRNRTRFKMAVRFVISQVRRESLIFGKENKFIFF
jgi:hypothetical protein